MWQINWSNNNNHKLLPLIDHLFVICQETFNSSSRRRSKRVFPLWQMGLTSQIFTWEAVITSTSTYKGQELYTSHENVLRSTEFQTSFLVLNEYCYCGQSVYNLKMLRGGLFFCCLFVSFNIIRLENTLT